MSTPENPRIQVDPRGPRFGAIITSILLATIIVVDQFAPTAALILLAAATALFAWGAFAGIQRHPWGAIFKRLIRPRLAPPAELEDAAAPTFAQGVGLTVTAIGLVAALLGVPHAVTVAAAIAFLAAFINAAFGLCLGCELYAWLIRAGIVGRGNRDRQSQRA